MIDEEKVTEVEKDEPEVKESPFTVTVGDEPPCARRRRIYRRKPKEETEEERLERIIRQSRPPVRPPIEGGLDPDDHECRLKRTLTQLREHCRKRGIKHPLFDKDYNKEVKD